MYYGGTTMFYQEIVDILGVLVAFILGVTIFTTIYEIKNKDIGNGTFTTWLLFMVLLLVWSVLKAMGGS